MYFLSPLPLDQIKDKVFVEHHRSRLQKLNQFLTKAIEECFAAKFIYEEDIKKYVFRGIETLESQLQELSQYFCTIFHIPTDSIRKNRNKFSSLGTFIGPNNKEKMNCLKLYRKLMLTHSAYHFFSSDLPELDYIDSDNRDYVISILHDYHQHLVQCYDDREKIVVTYLDNISLEKFPSKKALSPIITSTHRDVIFLLNNINQSALLTQTFLLIK